MLSPVPLLKARDLAEEYGVRIFTADIIYHLFDQFTAYVKEVRNAEQEAARFKVRHGRGAEGRHAHTPMIAKLRGGAYMWTVGAARGGGRGRAAPRAGGRRVTVRRLHAGPRRGVPCWLGRTDAAPLAPAATSDALPHPRPCSR
jgi:hypothetical protein